MATKKTAKSADDTDQLLSADDLIGVSPKRIEVPELEKNGKPGVVHVRFPSAGEMIALLEMSEEARTEGQLQMVARCVVKPDGSPMFTEEQAGDIRKLRMDVYMRLLNTLTASVNQGKAPGAAGDDSPSGSPVN